MPVGSQWDDVWFRWKHKSGAQERSPGDRYTGLGNESVKPQKPTLADLNRKGIYWKAVGQLTESLGRLKNQSQKTNKPKGDLAARTTAKRCCGSTLQRTVLLCQLPHRTTAVVAPRVIIFLPPSLPPSLPSSLSPSVSDESESGQWPSLGYLPARLVKLVSGPFIIQKGRQWEISEWSKEA